MTLGKALHVIVVILMVTFSNLQITEANADVRLSLDNPCFQGQDCTLNCSAVRGSKTDGYQYFQDSAQIVFCSGPSSCNSNVPAFQHDVGDSQSSSVTMVSFNPTSMSGSWQCQDGSSGTASNTYNVILNVEPSGNLSLSGDCPGSCTVSCSCDVLGSPPATLILSGSSGQLINGTTSPVTYVLQESDNVTCSVQWTEFPAYTLNILSVTSSFSISGLKCLGPCIFDYNVGFVSTLGVFCAADLLSIVPYIVPCLETFVVGPLQIRDFVTIAAVLCTIIFEFVVGLVSLDKCKECLQREYPDLHNGAVAVVVIGVLCAIAAFATMVVSIVKGRNDKKDKEKPEGTSLQDKNATNRDGEKGGDTEK